jgi:hypothetical protein
MESSWSTPGRGLHRLAPAALSLPLVAANAGLLLVFDLAHRLPLTLALLGAAFLALPFVARRLENLRVPLGGAILLGALLVRLPLLPLPPTLSDDALRYLWDGKVAAAGLNPYALAPAAERLTPLRDGVWRRLPHTQVPTVYPPLAVAVFSIASRLPFPLFAWKVLVLAADLLGCRLLLALARRLGVPEGRAVWYAWNPLVALEVAGMGHVDALGVAAVIGAVLHLTPAPLLKERGENLLFKPLSFRRGVGVRSAYSRPSFDRGRVWRADGRLLSPREGGEEGLADGEGEGDDCRLGSHRGSGWEEELEPGRGAGL